MTKPELIALARDLAATWELDPALVCAMVEQESAWDPWLSRYEHGFFNRYLDNSHLHLEVRAFVRAVPYTVSFDTELRERAFSRGLLQVVGQVARERGFKEPLPRLHDPEQGLAVGCAHLKWCLDRTGGDVRRALLRYNGGGDSQYPDKVLGRVAAYAS